MSLYNLLIKTGAMRIKLFTSILLFAFTYAEGQVVITSPDKKIRVDVIAGANGTVMYTVQYSKEKILRPSILGLQLRQSDFSSGLKLVNAGLVRSVQDRYVLHHGKKRDIIYKANKRIIRYRNKEGLPMDIIFQVSNDGVAFRYAFPGKDIVQDSIINEVTSFHFPLTARAWLQPKQIAKSGWEQSNPAYEENYLQDIPVGTPSPMAGWIYPALFRVKNIWLLITETAIDRYNCATILNKESPDGEYSIAIPDTREVFSGKGLLGKVSFPYLSPWRIITIGNLSAVIRSTLGTDLAKPDVLTKHEFIKPGKASWSWINSKDNFIIYDEQKKYIDFAADMKWQYCLVDADWDRKIGYEKIKELADYAGKKNVGLLLWYNSSGDWNTVKYSPKSRLLSHEERIKEFQRLKQMGIKGVKIDFFGGDGQSMMEYYIDILNDAGETELLVNFHGATLPRGWSRTYPHLLTTEAVKGFEMVTFSQEDADKQPNHCTMLPFTRNVFDPMDFTPMNLYKIQHSKSIRKTSSAFELALSVLFVSGIQHFAESPEGMSHVPAYVKDFLRQIPDTWSDVKFIDGYPGKYIVLARRAGNKWYVAGINGENTERKMQINTGSFGSKSVQLITDGKNPLSFVETKLKPVKKQEIFFPASGGFVMVIE